MLKIAMFTLAAAVTASVLAPTAHAAHSRIQFLAPSGNIGCQLGATPDGSGFAWCKADEHGWVTPQSDACPRANVPGAIGEPGGENLQLAEGQAPCFGFVMSQLFFDGQYAPPTLGYGEKRSVGSITCSVERAGVTCSDSKSGKYFQVSREAYKLG
ncbi:hypothetical protein [Mycolicibacterium sphagni]|uniref:Ig-like domain-containing protein n=1 Tax=Mycolicibacterium sphagni TaxID=1786 RepID=A0ABX2JVT2_9MYCO|nr:hypothetical protein [Mycolicibacterium sphagni]NTY60904.1 hypothetical protein [Mycolicibacterium sphagni]